MTQAEIEKYHPAFKSEQSASAAERYGEAGYVVAAPVLPFDLIQRARTAMLEVMAGRYETGISPRDEWYKPGDEKLGKLRKIDQSHVANRTIYEVITFPALGEWIARTLNAEMVQIWSTQLLYKPPAASPVAGSSVGWHQDYQYWKAYWTPESEVFTAWLAISDVDEQSGPLCFVEQSHRWGFQDRGNFFEDIGTSKEQQFEVPPDASWNEAAATMPAGAFSLHHKWTIHGSYPNQAMGPRMSFALHMRTERSMPLKDPASRYNDAMLRDVSQCPIIFGK